MIKKIKVVSMGGGRAQGNQKDSIAQLAGEHLRISKKELDCVTRDRQKSGLT